MPSEFTTITFATTLRTPLVADLNTDWIRQTWSGVPCSLKTDLSADATEMVVDRASWNDGGSWVPSITTAAAANQVAMYMTPQVVSERPASPSGFTVGCSVLIGRTEAARVISISEPDASTGAVTIGLSRGPEQTNAAGDVTDLPMIAKAAWPAGTNVSLLRYATPYEYVGMVNLMPFLNGISSAFGINSAIYAFSVKGRVQS